MRISQGHQGRKNCDSIRLGVHISNFDKRDVTYIMLVTFVTCLIGDAHLMLINFKLNLMLEIESPRLMASLTLILRLDAPS